jgi:hypothetical protein
MKNDYRCADVQISNVQMGGWEELSGGTNKKPQNRYLFPGYSAAI